MLGNFAKSRCERSAARMMQVNILTCMKLIAAGLGLAVASPGNATSYYHASGSVLTNVGNTSKYTTDPLIPQDVNLFGGNGWSIIATANDNNGGTVTADVGVPPNWSYDTNNYLQNISASSDLTYEFSILGAAAGTIVPVLVYASGHATQSDPNLGGFVQAGLQLGNISVAADDLVYHYIDTIGGPSEPAGGSFTINDIVSMQVGYTYRLSMSAYAKGRSDESLDEYAMPNGKYALFSAGVDPLFTILGNNASSFHFVGLPASAVGGATAAVPEPASWGMMVGGFGLIGAGMRYRRRVRPTTVASAG